MAKKKRLKKLARNILSTPKHKKMMANFLADYIGPRGYSIKDMLVYGHRGYLAMDEVELGKRFDKKYDEFCEELNKLIELVKSEGCEYDREIEIVKEKMAVAEKIYDEIFEKEFL